MPYYGTNQSALGQDWGIIYLNNFTLEQYKIQIKQLVDQILLKAHYYVIR